IKDPIPNIIEVNSTLPKGFNEVILKVLAKDPNDRFETTGELALGIKSAVGDIPLAKTKKPRKKASLVVDPNTDQLTMDSGEMAVGVSEKRKMPGWAWLVIVGLVAGIAYFGLGGLSASGASPTPVSTSLPASEGVNPTVPSHTSTPRPIATSTDIPASIQGLDSPVITDVVIRKSTTSSGLVLYQDIYFKDANGDASIVNYEIISSTISNLYIEDGTIDISTGRQKAGTFLTGTWECGDDVYSVVLSVTIIDRSGNHSDPYQYNLDCSD
ncbi:MAG: hypothetical protein V3S14_03895, partial [Anaerolineae bacterium]